MEIAVSPKDRNTDFSSPLTVDDKIKIFTNRTLGWQLEIADKLINGYHIGRKKNSGIQHSGFATLFIIGSYFEMIAKYFDGYNNDGKSKYYFKQGLKLVFPDFYEKFKDHENLLNYLYHNFRNGLYHGGMTGPRVSITGGINEVFQCNVRSETFIINPHLLTKKLIKHFKFYIKDLKNKENKEIRTNFEKRFDYNSL